MFYIQSNLLGHRSNSTNYETNPTCLVAAESSNCTVQWLLYNCAIDSMYPVEYNARGFRFSNAIQEREKNYSISSNQNMHSKSAKHKKVEHELNIELKTKRNQSIYKELEQMTSPSNFLHCIYI